MKSHDKFKFQSPEAEPDQNSGKRIAMIDTLEYQPMIHGIKNNLIRHQFDPIYSDPAGSTRCLRDGETEISLIPAVEYARSKETWNIVPGLGVSCAGSVLNVQLFFKKGLKDLKKIAVDNQAGSAAVLLKILMREKYMMSPEYIETPADLQNMLSRTDAALICGDKALEYYHQQQNRLDLNEEWVDLTGLPFVYSFWAGREFTITRNDVQLIRKSFDLGIRNLEYICKEYAARQKADWVFYHDFLAKNISYTFEESEKEGLLEFYNYAFFFGYTEFIPELHFY